MKCNTLIPNIFKFLTKRSTIKIASVVLILGMFFIMPTFAAETDPSMLADTRDFLTKLIGLLSRVWIFLAIIAGKLMTNDLVYGTFMHLDKYLRDIWNIMKNFANFGLALMILVSIVKYVIKKGDSDNPQKIVVKALLAGVLIQMSRFAVGALIDVSTIATSAIASFPAKFASTSNLENQMKSEIEKSQQLYSVKFEDGKLNRATPQPISDEGGACKVDDIDAILPKYDSVSGPLIFIGMSSLKIQNYMDRDTIADGDKLEGIIVNFALKALILVFFTLTLLLLCIANLVRILFLWLLVLAAPIVVLVSVFDNKIGESGSGKFAGYFNFKTFIGLIFKPVFFIGFLSLTLILITSMQQIMGTGKGIDDLSGITISTTTGDNVSSQIAVEGVAEFSITEDIFKDFGDMDPAKSVFVDLFIIFLTLMLLWKLLVWSLKFGEGPVQDVMEKITPLVQQLAGNLPIIPTSAGGIGFGQIEQAQARAKRKLLEGAGMSASGKFVDSENAFRRHIEENWLDIAPTWNTEDYRILRSEITKRDGDFWGKYQEFGSKRKEGMSLGHNGQWKLIEEWFDHNKSRKPQAVADRFGGGTPPTSRMSFEDYLGKGKATTPIFFDRLQSLHKLLGGDQATKKIFTRATTFDDMQNFVYHEGGS